MLILQPLWIFLLFSPSFVGVLGTEGDGIPDVTTIFTLHSDKRTENPVEIHVRNNNEGMPVFVENVGIVEPENEQRDLLCWHPISLGERSCNWTSNNFVWTWTQDYYRKDVIQNYGNIFKNSVAFSACGNMGRSYNYQSSCKIYLDLKTTGLSKYNPQMTIAVADRYCLANCDLSLTSMLCRAPDSLCFSHQSINIKYQNPLFFFIEIENTKYKVWKELNKTTLIFQDNVDDSSMNKLKTIRSSRSLELYHFKVLEATSSNSSLTSRPFQVTSSQFCLRVILQYQFTDREEFISASAVDSNNNYHHLGTLVHTGLAEWYSWKLKTSLPDELVGKSIQIVLRTLTSGTTRIQRIASCYSDDENVAVITPEMTDENRFLRRDPTVMLFHQDLKNFGLNQACDNGGVLTSVGCACPAGFAGTNCTQGCGPNRFGQDCGSQCSIYSRQCSGLMLCTPKAGCHCAPGYRGETCEQSCLPGTYGSDCSEICGQCLERDQQISSTPLCDMFTGLCQSCMPGYYSPFCKSKYTHFITAPLLTTAKYGTVNVSINFGRGNIIGSGEPSFYQVQYKSGKDAEDWSVFNTEPVPQDLDSETRVDVEVDGLEDGVQYQVRVVLLAQDLNSYQAEDVPSAHVSTKCDVPLSYDYNISVTHSMSEGIPLQVPDSGYVVTSFSWPPYKVENHMCSLVEYEVSWKERWLWDSKTLPAQENFLQLANLLTNQKLSFKVRAKTTAGYAPYSAIFHTRTPYKGIFRVTNLIAKNITSDRASISWQPPVAFKEPEYVYTVTYTCVYRASCESPCQSEGSLTTKDTSVELSHLLPVSQYRVSVSTDGGPNTTTFIATIQSVPVETPKASELEPVRTNSSVTVFWEHAPICSGFFKNYSYQLYQTSDQTKIIDSGKTSHKNVTFSHLNAATDYTVRVSMVTTGGWDPDTYLAINISTSATVPEAVQNLTVYKRSRGSVGLRWAEPRALFGALSSFSVTYWPISTGPETKNTSVRVEPKRCAVWPHLYCYTLEGLSPGRSYSFIVRARNAVIPEDGAGALVTAVTRESSPGAPEHLSVINVTSTSLGLQWEHPNLTNGILRSFLVSVEEAEQFDHDQCCEIYPIFETVVTEERRFYMLEVSNLHPASTYSISVAGKTVGFGPSLTVTASTRPPSMYVPLPELDVDWVSNPKMQWETQKLSESNNSLAYTPLIKSCILVVISNTSLVDAAIEDVRLKSLLESRISKPFYITAEFKEGDTVSLHQDDEEQSQWGLMPRPQFQENVEYQLATVQISEYNGVLNTDIVFSTPFHIGYQSSNAVES